MKKWSFRASFPGNGRPCLGTVSLKGDAAFEAFDRSRNRIGEEERRRVVAPWPPPPVLKWLLAGVVLLLMLAPGGAMSQGSVVITEFMAINNTTLTNQNGAYPDWIEIYNG